MSSYAVSWPHKQPTEGQALMFTVTGTSAQGCVTGFYEAGTAGDAVEQFKAETEKIGPVSDITAHQLGAGTDDADDQRCTDWAFAQAERFAGC